MARRATVVPWNNLRNLRVAAGMRRQDLSDKLGVSQNTLGLWEACKQPIPQARIPQILVTLGCAQEQLFIMDEAKKVRGGRYEADWIVELHSLIARAPTGITNEKIWQLISAFLP